jgi:hypothetical protein
MSFPPAREIDRFVISIRTTHSPSGVEHGAEHGGFSYRPDAYRNGRPGRKPSFGNPAAAAGILFADTGLMAANMRRTSTAQQRLFHQLGSAGSAPERSENSPGQKFIEPKDTGIWQQPACRCKNDNEVFEIAHNIFLK